MTNEEILRKGRLYEKAVRAEFGKRIICPNCEGETTKDKPKKHFCSSPCQKRYNRTVYRWLKKLNAKPKKESIFDHPYFDPFRAANYEL